MEPGDICPESGELMSDERWLAEIDGKRADPWKIWMRVASHPITEEEYQWLMALSPLLPNKIPSR